MVAVTPWVTSCAAMSGSTKRAVEPLTLLDARVAVDHLRLRQVAREHRVAVAVGSEVDRADEGPARVVPRVATERLVVVDDLVAVGLRRDRLGVEDGRARAGDQLARQPGLVLDRGGVVGLDRSGPFLGVPRVGRGVGQLDLAGVLEAERRELTSEGVGAGHGDAVGVRRPRAAASRALSGAVSGAASEEGDRREDLRRHRPHVDQVTGVGVDVVAARLQVLRGRADDQDLPREHPGAVRQHDEPRRAVGRPAGRLRSGRGRLLGADHRRGVDGEPREDPAEDAGDPLVVAARRAAAAGEHQGGVEDRHPAQGLGRAGGRDVRDGLGVGVPQLHGGGVDAEQGRAVLVEERRRSRPARSRRRARRGNRSRRPGGRSSRCVCPSAADRRRRGAPRCGPRPRRRPGGCGPRCRIRRA